MGHIQLNLGNLLHFSKLSQARLAKRTGLRPGTISALADGKVGSIHFTTLVKLLDGLNNELDRRVSIEDLLIYDSGECDVQPNGSLLVFDTHGFRYFLLEDGTYRPVKPRVSMKMQPNH